MRFIGRGSRATVFPLSRRFSTARHWRSPRPRWRSLCSLPPRVEKSSFSSSCCGKTGRSFISFPYIIFYPLLMRTGRPLTTLNRKSGLPTPITTQKAPCPHWTSSCGPTTCSTSTSTFLPAWSAPSSSFSWLEDICNGKLCLFEPHFWALFCDSLLKNGPKKNKDLKLSWVRHQLMEKNGTHFQSCCCFSSWIFILPLPNSVKR